MKKNIGIVFLVLIIAALCVKIFFYPVEKEVRIEVPAEAKAAVDADVKNIITKLDEKGDEHAIMQDKENVIRSINELDDSSQNEVDSVKNLLRIKDNQLKEWIQYAATLEGEELPAEPTETGFRYKDRYALIELVKPNDTSKNEYFNFKYDAQINYAEYWKRDWFLGKKKHYIDFWIADPRATINGAKRVKFTPSEPKVKVDVNAASYYTDRLNVGFDGGVTVGRARLGGGYYYDMVDNEWKPLISVTYRLLDF